MRFAAPPTHPCSHYNAICIHTLQNTNTRRTQEVPFIAGCIHITRPTHPCSHYNVICIHTLQNTKRDAAAPAAHKTHYTETHKIWCSGFLPKTKPMQQSCRHYNAFCSITWQTCMYLRTWQQNMTRIRQPLQCDLQSEIKEAHKSTHTWTTTRCRTPRENRFDDETIAAATATHTHKVPFIASSSHITRKHRVWCSGFLSNTTPTQVHATFMPPLQCVLQHHVAKPACIYAHDNCLTTRNSNHAVIALRSATTDATNTEKQKVWCSGFLPKTNPM